MNKLILFICLIIGFSAFSQDDGFVPKQITFAGMTLHLNNAVRGKIQAEVNLIRKNEKYFRGMVDKANIYFPVVEEMFRQENFPDDIKYLLIQESAFNADAVSTSNAVGFWQFKEGTAKEVGLLVEGGIDERKNLAASSRGAARYMSKTNLKVKNWVYALLSYNVGPGGVMSHVENKYVGVSKMDIDAHTHWYIIKFLAHKLAYEGEIHKKEPSIYLAIHDNFSGKSLKQIAKSENIEEEELYKYNRWISESRKIPEDRTFLVIVPSSVNNETVYATTGTPKPDKPISDAQSTYVYEVPKKGDVVEVYSSPKENIRYRVNDVQAIVAIDGDNSHKLALVGEITKKQFIAYNEIQSFTQLVPGLTYFISKKKNTAKVNFHVVKKGENIWLISQMYAMNTKAIRKKNLMKLKEEPEEGRVLWLRRTRPVDTPVEYRKASKEELSQKNDTVKNIPEKEVLVEFRKEDPIVKAENQQVMVKNIPEEVSDVKFHTVEAGETLYGISKKYGVSVDELLRLNQLTDSNLKLGMKLIIENKSNKQTLGLEKNKKTYIVQQGDTFYSISKKFNIGVPELLKINNKPEPVLKIGEQLIVE